MTYTLGTTITKVQNKLDDSGFSSTILTDFANDTQREVFGSKFMQFMEATEDFVLTPSVASIGTLPTDLQLPINLRVISPPTLATVLEPITAEVFDSLYSSNATAVLGAPTQWYPFANTINVYPLPASAITLQLRYYKNPTELTTSSDVPEIPEAFQEVLVLGMYKRALEYNDSFDQSAFITVKMEKLLEDMTRRYSPLTSGPTRMGINLRRGR
jgi:hypothetical protein